MSINGLIINSSPLIVLLKSQQAQLIPQLFTEILVPSGVFEEITIKDDIASSQLPTVSWIQTVEVNTIEPKELTLWHFLNPVNHRIIHVLPIVSKLHQYY
jgi:predicted nucleic acid-binding protein